MLLLMVTLFLTPMLAGCAPTGMPSRSPDGAGPAEGPVETDAPAAADIDDAHIVTVEAYGPPAALVVDLWARRTSDSVSEPATLSVAISALASGGAVCGTFPELDLQAVTPTGTVELLKRLDLRQNPDTYGGFSMAGLQAALPKNTLRVAAVVHLGPSRATAQKGLRVEVDVSDIPIVATPEPIYPWAPSIVF